MCLYAIKMKNPHYLANKQNGGVIPRYKDARTLHIQVGCGWCKECRKEKANEWKIRIWEEVLSNKQCDFVTLTFSPDKIKQLKEEIFEKKWKGLEEGELDVNILAGYAIRMFTERWRKKYKKSPRHWFITELGHSSSERIHLHGIIWQTHEQVSREELKNDIIDKWGYGRVDIGKWVDMRTINYIAKYITKTDKDHEGYKPKTFVSQGLGKDYLWRRGEIENAWRGEETITYYRASNGAKISLPRYYKNKLYSREQREQLWRWNMDKGILRLNGSTWEQSKSDDMDVRNAWRICLKSTRETNIRAGYGDNCTVNNKYIVTPAMELNYRDINILRDKIVTKIKRRQLKKTEEYNEVELISKTWDVKKNIWGQYIGNLTDGERKKNEEMAEAEEMGISVRKLRLVKAGIITNLFINQNLNNYE